ncbi:MAG: SulP family inorganic anion transporter, partial [Magnetococcales bacterium]|nr:SulP family inorganic anion transporter [Magnetococcales bacterium]
MPNPPLPPLPTSGFARIRGDLTAAAVATLIAVPESIAYGALAFSPLGEAYIPQGIAAGLIALTFANLAGALASPVRIMHNGAFSLSALMMAAILSFLIARVAPGGGELAPETVTRLLVLLFFSVFLAGAMQLLFGMLGLGQVVKYIPHPVLSGLLNGTAILVLATQLRFFLGGSFARLADNPAHLLTPERGIPLLVGGTTLGVILLARWLGTRISPFLLGIAAGTMAHALLVALAGTATAPALPLPSPIPLPVMTLPTPYLAEPFFALLASPGAVDPEILLRLLPLALSLAFLISLSTLLAAATSDRLLLRRSDPNRELISQGIGNITAALFGGVVSVGSITRTAAIHATGGRSNLAQGTGGLLALGVLLFLHPIVTLIPPAVIAAVLIILAFRLFDRWSFTLVADRLHGRSIAPRQSLFDIAAIILVIVVL